MASYIILIATTFNKVIEQQNRSYTGDDTVFFRIALIFRQQEKQKLFYLRLFNLIEPNSCAFLNRWTIVFFSTSLKVAFDFFYSNLQYS